MQQVRKVLEKLREKALPVKLSKCEFYKYSVDFLGYIVSEDGLAVDPKKVKAIEEWPELTNVTEVQAFNGTVNFYRKFIKDFLKVAGPLTELTKKEVVFYFGEECKKAFKELKRLMTSASILRIFDPEKESTLETDASDKALGGYLKQKDENGKLHPVVYYLRKMTLLEANYNVHDKEILAVVECLRTWRVYLEGAKYPVQIYSDYRNLTYWTITKELNRR